MCTSPATYDKQSPFQVAYRPSLWRVYWDSLDCEDFACGCEVQLCFCISVLRRNKGSIFIHILFPVVVHNECISSMYCAMYCLGVCQGAWFCGKVVFFHVIRYIAFQVIVLLLRESITVNVQSFLPEVFLRHITARKCSSKRVGIMSFWASSAAGWSTPCVYGVHTPWFVGWSIFCQISKILAELVWGERREEDEWLVCDYANTVYIYTKFIETIVVHLV